MRIRSLGVRINGQVMGWDEAFQEAATNPLRPWPYTPDMLALLAGLDDDEPDDRAFSPSRLLGCHRESALKTEHGYYVDAENSWPLVRGNMVHALMERARYPGALDIIREKRFYTTIQTKYGPQQFTAKPDLIVAEHLDGGGVLHLKIVDYKSKGKIEHSLTEASFEHELQVCMYALIVTRELARELGSPVVVDEVEIDYVDMSRVRRFTSAGWLTDRGKLISRKYGEYETLHLAPIRLWSLPKVERFVRRRIEERIQASRVLPPILKEEERWRCLRCPVREKCYQQPDVKGAIA